MQTAPKRLHAGDVVSVRSNVLEVRDKSIRMRHELMNDETGEVAAVTEITGALLCELTRKARPLPWDVSERVFSLFVDESEAQHAGSDALRAIPQTILYIRRTHSQEL